MEIALAAIEQAGNALMGLLIGHIHRNPQLTGARVEQGAVDPLTIVRASVS